MSKYAIERFLHRAIWTFIALAVLGFAFGPMLFFAFNGYWGLASCSGLVCANVLFIASQLSFKMTDRK